MRTYRVIVHGVFAPVPSPGGLLGRGFYTARTVTAASRDAAALMAFRAVHDTPRLGQIVARARLEAPDLSVDEIVDLGPGRVADGPEQGFIFYDESESELAPGYYAVS